RIHRRRVRGRGRLRQRRPGRGGRDAGPRRRPARGHLLARRGRDVRAAVEFLRHRRPGLPRRGDGGGGGRGRWRGEGPGGWGRGWGGGGWGRGWGWAATCWRSRTCCGTACTWRSAT